MSMLKDFRDFAMRGNVLDLAVAVIIGSAFGKIVASFVNDVLMPPIGILLGGMDFKQFKVILKAAHDTVPAVTLNYGMFIQTLVDFLIIAFSIFMVIKMAQRMQRKKAVDVPPPPPEPSNEEKLLTEIRDLLKKK